ncbi:ArsR family transcriptional regulator [Amycolatopsis mediterranei S699]|uniref:ArsR family transcriptional regulator n=2 Tax=Amycolatopsis mediterranei TaxID=33910 RepID=A0A0H3DC49_AMYMU|nr:metalloregulator ArsR/SmtB family transcription factor [Amycolatopsis mediterranei]ADJ47219.1 ArsR family transcriptional regulator [Amycolatopsis mediterranei U32]AEK44042.1 ArsR family transcriptional regulator [Amycolatopsis mediterranei S699]AFO78930.1 ArsR family transcriptional regulator [Amycolatopsis mediterranei S699]AGT86058.1 ArsR family transcriptional regulator [Amycolatopsis mediterranei RB]KDO04760.1 ArsR family transcriptional regulator [Amycolatopsis mediterranei]
MPTRARATEPLYRIKADLFKSLAHPIRIQVLEVLAAAGEEGTPVTRLLEVTDCEASHLSQHLAVLRRTGVVTSTRTGNAVEYWLAQPLVAELLVVARAFLLSSLSADSGRLQAARELPPLPGASPQAVLDAIAARA